MKAKVRIVVEVLVVDVQLPGSYTSILLKSKCSQDKLSMIVLVSSNMRTCVSKHTFSVCIESTHTIARVVELLIILLSFTTYVGNN